MKILGISSNYHDASAALVVDGIVIASAAEERFTSQKHDPSFPHAAIEFCLKEASLTSSDLDLIVYHEDPHTKFSRTLTSSFKNFPFSLSTFIKSSKEMLTSGFWIKNDISKKLDIDPSKILYIPHHMSHASHAFFTSPFDEAAILTIDALGEWTSTCLFNATKNSDGDIKIVPIAVISFPHSLGLVYSAFTAFLGFKVNDGECSTMALAAFGKPSYASEVRKIIKLKADGCFEVDINYFNFSHDDRLPLTKKFISVFGEPRQRSEKLLFDCMEEKFISDPDQIRFANIAASIQLVTEEIILSLVEKIKKMTGQNNLCYAGGVALNCIANSKILHSNIFENVYIPPDPGDGGGAMGSALYASHLFDKEKTKPRTISPYLGESYNTDSMKEVLQYLDTKNWSKFSKIPITQINSEDFHFFELPRDQLLKFTADHIYNGFVIGWCQGRFENGPRALGNRSLLIRPDDLSLAKKLSKKIKLRSSFRPYSCSIADFEASNFFTNCNNFQLGSWMQTSYKIKHSFLKSIQAAAHIDQTTRAQICLRDDNPLYYDLLCEYKKLSGSAVVLNTSFNEQGFPLVSNPYDALIMFARTELDILVINNLVITKRKI
jgi:carbamoyltransferase